MSDDVFPSGEWTGFYNYAPADKHRMDIALEFSNGSLSGAGCDGVGQFVLKGHYDPATKECAFTKSYLGAHSVFYRGFREGKGIWGTWEIGAWFHGGFHIWPRKHGSTDSAIETVERCGECQRQPGFSVVVSRQVRRVSSTSFHSLSLFHQLAPWVH